MFFCIIVILISVVISSRPNQQSRKFYDSCLDEAIVRYSNRMSPQLYQIFENSFPNTLDTTISYHDPAEPITYIITGDIPAMWLRDSTNQIIPYLKLSQTCSKIKTLVQGLINMQSKFIMVDPYTNAFSDYGDPSRPFYLNDKSFKNIMGIEIDLIQNTQFSTKRIWQRKFEIDSLANYLRLIYEYSHRYQTQDYININVIKAIKRLLSVIEEQLNDDTFQRKNKIFYKFLRSSSQLKNGTIMPSSRIGLVRSGFRPSDEPNKLAFNIPGNAMLSIYLEKVGTMLENLNSKFYRKISTNLAIKMKSYGKVIKQSIFKYGVFIPDKFDKHIFAYQIDGKGKRELYDDANMPSLLSLPLFDFVKTNDQIYMNTRKFILSTSNPFYFEHNTNKTIRGIGSSHTPHGSIWPLAVITQALTSEDDQQIKQCLQLIKTSSLRNLIHESFNINNVQSITRQWFAWGNSYFGQLILDLVKRKPHLVK